MAAAVLLIAAALVIFYVLMGYPLLLALLKFGAAPAVRRDRGFRPAVTVALPVYNGAEFIRAKLESLLALNYPKELMEILVISDGSTDGTDEAVESFSGRGVRLLRLPRSGKAAALNAALEKATGEILFLTDVRQRLEPDSLARLVSNFADPSVGAVSGELRFLNPDRAGEQADMELYWRYELWVRRRHGRIDSIFGATGCICALRRELAQPIPEDTLDDDIVMPLRAFLRGYRVILEPEALAFDYPTLEGGEFRRKLRTQAGLWQALVRTPELFTRANRMRFHFFSHKFARLALPWAILLALGATVALPASPFRSFLLADEAAFVVFAAIDGAVPKRLFLKRITSPARTFLVMNAAALLAVTVFVVPPRIFWGRTRVKT